MKRDKKVMGVMLVIGALLIVGITYAWSDLYQHKTNTVLGRGAYKNVTLIESFDSEIAKDFSMKKPLEKLVSVKNVGDEPIYVRLKIKEFLQTFNESYVTSNLRYVTNKEGEHIKVSSDLDKLQAVMSLNQQLSDMGYHDLLTVDDFAISQDKDNYQKRMIHKLKDFHGHSSYYVTSIDGDMHGQYGKHLTLATVANADKATILEGGGDINKRPSTAGDGHHYKNDISKDSDCNLFKDINFYRNDNRSRKYIELVQNQERNSVVSIDDFIKDKDSYSLGVWLYHESDNYLYYSKPLAPKEISGYALEGLKMILTPLNSFEYLNHIDLEAVSEDEMDSYWRSMIPIESLVSDQKDVIDTLDDVSVDL